MNLGISNLHCQQPLSLRGSLLHMAKQSSAYGTHKAGSQPGLRNCFNPIFYQKENKWEVRNWLPSPATGLQLVRIPGEERGEAGERRQSREGQPRAQISAQTRFAGISSARAFSQSPEGQAGMPEPAVPQRRAMCSAHLLHRGPRRTTKDKGRGTTLCRGSSSRPGLSRAPLPTQRYVHTFFDS